MASGNEQARLEKLIETGSKDDCLAFFEDMPPDERRGYAPFVKKKYKEADRNARWDEQQNALVCLLATATLGELKKLGWRALPRDGFLLEIVRTLEPDWAGGLVQFLAEDEPFAYTDIRLLYEAGLCEKPTGDGYILGMIQSLPGWNRRSERLWDRHMPLAERIRSTPDIRDEDVWRLFEVEGGGEISLANFDKYIGGKGVGLWAMALVELAADGTLDRDRLLDESLRTLARDFAQYRAGWFSRFHELLEPTLEERAARREQYLRLLGSSIPPTVSFALKAISLLDKADRLSADEILDNVKPVLQARAKGTVTAGLALLARAAKRQPADAIRAARRAADALLHEAADVQNKALDLIESLSGQSDPDVVNAMKDYAEGIAPSVRARFDALLGADTASKPTASTPSNEDVQRHVRVEPIASFEELNSEWLRILEDPSSPLDVERLVDGLARWGAAKPEEFTKKIGPLAKRAKTIIERESVDRLQHLIAWLAALYASETDIRQGPFVSETETGASHSNTVRETGAFAEVFAQRGAELLLQIQDGHRLPLLSAPTDSRGFVAADALIARYAEYRSVGVEPGATDTALALLRLDPEGRDAALGALEPADEVEQAIACALGREVPIGETSWLWVAAAAAQRPYEDQPAIATKHGRSLPDAGTKARYEIGYTNSFFTTVSVQPTISDGVPRRYLACRFHIAPRGAWNLWSTCGEHVNMIRWSAMVWPLNLEAFFSQGLRVFNHDQRLANSPYAGFLEPMLADHVYIGDVGSALLMLGLASSDPAVRSVAQDAAIASIAEERVSIDTMQIALAALMSNGRIPIGRWTKTLGEVAANYDRHAGFVRDLIAGSLRHEPASPPRDIGGLVELLYELSVLTETPVSDAQTLEYLRAVTGGGKLKRFADKLLASR